MLSDRPFIWSLIFVTENKNIFELNINNTPYKDDLKRTKCNFAYVQKNDY